MPSVGCGIAVRCGPYSGPKYVRGVARTPAAFDQKSRFSRTRRRGEQIALNLLATERVEHRELFLGLDAFREHGESQLAAERDHRTHDGGFLRLERHAVNERLVDLQTIHGQT